MIKAASEFWEKFSLGPGYLEKNKVMKVADNTLKHDPASDWIQTINEGNTHLAGPNVVLTKVSKTLCHLISTYSIHLITKLWGLKDALEGRNRMANFDMSSFYLTPC